ncbi:hypothetical protein ABH930_002421 [Kitasatospora sp. GAS204A]|uniref:hypothetical protein n=1 Tax=unclassified Kitasatospora TaxID=2633591 RepID=UPI0024768477|nr:hypothetical protein [Kitasatospora sp. GAS204B]MDH6121574.1 hypothetical protein [Kitasatospora sp. GAS204B]
MTLTMLLLTVPPLLALLLSLTDPARRDAGRARARATGSALGLTRRGRGPRRVSRKRGRHAAPVGRRAQASLSRAV